MIERYTRAPFADLWSDERKLQDWLAVELAAVEAWHHEGVVPEASWRAIEGAEIRVDAERVLEIERTTRHDVAAFVQHLEEQIGPEHGRWIHFGLTSSDVLDSSLAMLLAEATDMLLKELDALRTAVADRAREHALTPTIGRSHGIHAEITTVGHKLAIWYDELGRHRERLSQVRRTIATGKLSGAVGTFATIPPAVERRALSRLGLRCAPASSQVVQRDRHAAYFTALALLASSLEKFAIEIRHLQRTEVGEAEERFHAGQKGSSAMPHKRNPVLSENITGLARLVRGYALPAMENVALWHERDISHSSVERVIAPDATALLDFALHRMRRVVEQLVFYPERMQANIDRSRNLPFSQHVLLALVRAGLSRQEAYALVQRRAMEAWDQGLDFRQLVEQDEDIGQYLDVDSIAQAFSLEHALRHIPDILERTFGSPEDES